jgi:hypothetical protein
VDLLLNSCHSPGAWKIEKEMKRNPDGYAIHCADRDAFCSECFVSLESETLAQVNQKDENLRQSLLEVTTKSI